MGYLDERADLAGKVAVVVGGAFGVGAAVTMALAEAGVDIAFCDRKADAVKTTQAAVRGLGRRASGRVTDAFDPAQLDAFYDACDKEFNRVDILVNVAGEAHIRRFPRPTAEWPRMSTTISGGRSSRPAVLCPRSGWAGEAAASSALRPSRLTGAPPGSRPMPEPGGADQFQPRARGGAGAGAHPRQPHRP